MNETNQRNLLDPNMDKRINKCFINEHKSKKFANQIFVIYEDGSRENIWTYDSRKFEFDRDWFISKSKLEALFICDRVCNSKHVFDPDARTYDY